MANSQAYIFILMCVSAMTLCTPGARAQQLEWDEFVENLADCEWATEDDNEDLITELTDLHEHPLDLNNATREELAQLPFLHQEAIDAIVDYRTKNGWMHSLGELLLIEKLGYQEQQMLRLFCFVEEEQEATDRIKPLRSRSEISTRLDLPFYKRQGWSWVDGIGQRMQWRYEGSKAIVQAPAGGQWLLGLKAESDAGEPMFTRQRPLWDAMGGYASLRTSGWLRTLIIGDFRAKWGEGLVMNTGFVLGKTSMGLWSNGAGLRPHTSYDEIRFLRGCATTLSLVRGFDVSAFWSRRLLDATLNADGSCHTLLTTGLHRTESELARRHQLTSYTSAVHLQWENSRIHLGTTGMYQAFDRVMSPGNALYRRHAPRGYHFGAASFDYSLRLYPFYVSGETARNFSATGDNGWATINKGVWRINVNTQLSVVQRYYSYRYFSHHAAAFGENSGVQNESGVCLALDANRMGPVSLNTYVDFFYSPWPRYSMTRNSYGTEVMAGIRWQPSRQWALQLRYKMKSKEQSDMRFLQHRARLTWEQRISKLWELSTTAFMNWRQNVDIQSLSRGFAFMPRVTFHSPDNRWRWAMAVAYFRADDFNNRIYVYEPTLLQSMGFVSLYGRGGRLATTLRYVSPQRRWFLQAKLGCTRFTDRSFQSSGPLLISSPWKTDVQLLLRYRW